MNFLPCGDCTACCDGNLLGDAYGLEFGKGVGCTFLCNKKCTIYQFRPDSCKKYQCAYTQGLFPEWMKPTLSNVLVSVEVDHKNKKQYLKVIPINNSIKNEVLEFLDKWTQENNTYYIICEIPNENKSRMWLKKA